MLKANLKNALLGAAIVVPANLMSSTAMAGTDLSLMIWDPAQLDGVQKAVEAFEETHPDIDVTVEQAPRDQFYSRLDAALGAGAGPDVMWQSSRASYYVDGGVIEPLDAYIERDGLSLDGYNPTITALYNFGGTQYGIPKDFDAWTVAYNARVFSDLGIQPPSADWTWDDMLRIGEQVKARSEGAVMPLYIYYNWNNGIVSLMQSMGGKAVDGQQGTMDSPEGIRALGMMKDLQDRGLITKVADSADLNSVNALISGTIAMAEVPSWNLSLLSRADVPEGTFHVLHLPAVDGKWASDTNGLSYMMNANSRHKDAAWELIKFLTSDDGAVLHAEGGAGLPANSDPRALQAFVAANKPLAGLEDALAAQQPYPRTTTAYPAVIAGQPRINTAIMSGFYAGEISAEEAAAQIDKVLDEALK